MASKYFRSQQAAFDTFCAVVPAPHGLIRDLSKHVTRGRLTRHHDLATDPAQHRLVQLRFGSPAAMLHVFATVKHPDSDDPTLLLETLIMKRLFVFITTGLLIGSLPIPAAGAQLTSGEYFVTQSWSQEKKFHRPYYVRVPKGISDLNKGEQRKYPVFVLLHGGGGTAKRAMRRHLKQYPTIAKNYVMVFPNGYRNSWNIVSERSKADDRGFIEAIIEHLATYDNVQRNNFTIMGNSNGAALANQMAIESRLPNIRNYLTGVSQLNVFQHDGRNFKAQGANNDYQTFATPLAGKRLMNISGADDHTVPYRGGPSGIIPARGGRLEFIDAEESIFLWAKAMGYGGNKLSRPSRIAGKLEIYSYLDGDVVHYKVNGSAHGATRMIDEKILLTFIERMPAD
jgi:polyhydroxybutyrate depolymerase